MSNDLTTEELESLIGAAHAAWDKLGPRGRSATFNWRGKPYVVTHSNLRLIVSTPEGAQVAYQYD